jgi:NAD(P)-dependent dehydrogenase (short-subunit alcohol dehydrogenase family)
MTKKWTPAQMADQTGRTVVVTGASSGIGLAAARELTAHGAHVIAAVRNIDKARGVLGDSADIRHLDLSDLDSVRAFAATVDGSVDVLLNNAGVMAIPLARTAQGFEMQIGTNHLGHFALTGLLLPQITDRVVTVASSAHRMGRIRLDDLNWHRRYSPWLAYGQSKLANLLFTSELQRRLSASGSAVRAFAVHPGYSNTALQGHTGSGVQNRFMAWANRVVAQSDTQGAWPSLYAVTQDLPGNSFIGPDGFAEVKGHPKLVKGLWELSEDLTGVRFLD